MNTLAAESIETLRLGSLFISTRYRILFSFQSSSSYNSNTPGSYSCTELCSNHTNCTIASSTRLGYMSTYRFLQFLPCSSFFRYISPLYLPKHSVATQPLLSDQYLYHLLLVQSQGSRGIPRRPSNFEIAPDTLLSSTTAYAVEELFSPRCTCLLFSLPYLGLSLTTWTYSCNVSSLKMSRTRLRLYCRILQWAMAIHLSLFFIPSLLMFLCCTWITYFWFQEGQQMIKIILIPGGTYITQPLLHKSF